MDALGGGGVPRRENPLGPADDVLTGFAADLRGLREDAGAPTYRQLSARAHYSAAALSEAASGRKLPSLPVTLAYVRACDGDTAEWERRWRELAATQAKETPDEETRPDETVPYPGPVAFGEQRADVFFGRAALVATLTAMVGEERLTAVVGASGAGTTSLLRAGLAPTLTDHVVMTPGRRPLEECAVRLAEFLGVAPGDLHHELTAAPENLHLRIRQALTGRDGDLVIVVDRFEDVFTRAEQAERDGFVAALVHAATTPTSRTRVVLGVRADFDDRLPDAARVEVGALTADELREAITEPAATVGCRVETALLVRLIADAGGPGTLPFLQQALLEVWRRRRGTTLSIAGYEAAGGIPRLIADAAEDVYTGMPHDRRLLARHLLSRLAATADRVRRDDLDVSTAAVLDELVAARVVVVDRDRVTLTGRTLREDWPRLGTWLAEDGDRLRAHRELAEATATWEALDRDPGALYRGMRLDAARTWLTVTTVVTAREREFLAASVAAHTGERRRVRGLRAGLALLSVLVVLATAALAYAVRAELTADRQRNVALAQGALREAVALRNTNPALAMQLTLAAHRLDPTDDSRAAILGLFTTPYAARLTGHAGPVNAVAVTGDGTLLATTGDDTTRLWDLADPLHPKRLEGLGKGASSVAFAGDGLTAIGEKGRATLWNLTNHLKPLRLRRFDTEDPGTASRVALSADGGTLAMTQGNDVQLWDTTTYQKIRTLTGHKAAVTSVVFSQDGTYVATASADRTARVWPVTGGKPQVLDGSRPSAEDATTGSTAQPGGTAQPGEDTPATAELHAVAFRADGRYVATAGADGWVRLWQVSDGAQLPKLPVGGGAARDVTFSPAGNLLAVTGDDRRTVVWNVSTPEAPHDVTTLVGHTDTVTSVRFTPDGTKLITGSRDRTVRITDLAEVVGGSGAGDSLAWGSVLASGGDDTVQLYDMRDRHAPRAAGTVEGTNPALAGDLLATDGRLWQVAKPDQPEHMGETGDGQRSALSRDGRLLVTYDNGDEPRLWSVTDPTNPQHLADLRVNGIRAAVWGDNIVATLGSDITLWDVRDPRNPKPRPLPARETTESAPAWAGMALTPDGKVLAAVAEDGTGSLWAVDGKPRKLARFTAGTTPAPAFSQDGRTLVTASGPAPRMWDVSDPSHPTEIATLSNDHGGGITAIAFSRDGRSFATTSAGTLHIWDATVDEVERHVCAVVFPRIGRDEWHRYLPDVTYDPVCP